MKKINVEIEMCEDFYKDMENVAKTLGKSVEWIIQQEVKYDLRDILVWLERAHVLKTYDLL